MSLSEADRRYLDLRFHRIERLIRMATQAEVDAITAEVASLVPVEAAILAGISELEAQVAAGQPVDLSALKAAADQLSAGVAAAQGALPVAASDSGDASVPTTSSSS